MLVKIERLCVCLEKIYSVTDGDIEKDKDTIPQKTDFEKCFAAASWIINQDSPLEQALHVCGERPVGLKTSVDGQTQWTVQTELFQVSNRVYRTRGVEGVHTVRFQVCVRH